MEQIDRTLRKLTALHFFLNDYSSELEDFVKHVFPDYIFKRLAGELLDPGQAWTLLKGRNDLIDKVSAIKNAQEQEEKKELAIRKEKYDEHDKKMIEIMKNNNIERRPTSSGIGKKSAS